jgi:putative chitinase
MQMKFNITPELLKEIAGPSADDQIVHELAKHLPEVLETYGINTDLRITHFLVQCACQSDNFRTLESYESGDLYETRKDLGNVNRGDGKRYKRRGLIHILGRTNYENCGNRLGIDLVSNPELASDPRNAIIIACEYWRVHNLEFWADKNDGKQITRKITGNYNDLKKRLAMIDDALKAVQSSKMSLLTPVVRPEPVPEPVVELPPAPEPVPEPTPEPVKSVVKIKPKPVIKATLPVGDNIVKKD